MRNVQIGVVTLIGGGNNPQPGEISLVHNGVPFLPALRFKTITRRSESSIVREWIEAKDAGQDVWGRGLA